MFPFSFLTKPQTIITGNLSTSGPDTWLYAGSFFAYIDVNSNGFWAAGEPRSATLTSDGTYSITTSLPPPWRILYSISGSNVVFDIVPAVPTSNLTGNNFHMYYDPG